ncbi:hypothetical protein [Halopseudomonas salegens]|uniref:Transcriptional regulator SutA RNAP-binding domain-containing protein n=1 Tax=Halopseudomonas salegens TaxID=1434072 RepID=A0A1H2HBE3_9GAMM|nr:hypothetical protein [Halopseudomonas salegens]SDU29112.1 hypothetical protein SAMN05216210_2913 [Halopseudomonas salegens]
MSTDDLDDDMDAVDNDDLDGLPEADEDDSSVKSRKKAAAVSNEDELEGASLAAKERERQFLAQQIEEYLARGGKVQEVSGDVLNDPPRKPESKYGSRPI